ncbi:MAG: hypothetical protein J6X18_06505 [Bacteroidales bacterium]|nr:hypothetical protein [Bacteroidales bacterium]
MEYNIILKDGNENTLRPQTTLQQVNGLTEALSNKGSNPDRTANSESKQIGYKVLDSRTTFQNQVTSENTIYEIRDVFDLDNSSTISFLRCSTPTTIGNVTYYTCEQFKVPYQSYIIMSPGQSLFEARENTLLFEAFGTYYYKCSTFGYSYRIGLREDGGTTLQIVEPFQIPKGCTLKFNGGCLTNGAIELNETLVEAPSNVCIFSDVMVMGDASQECYVDWFGAIGQKTKDTRNDATQEGIQMALDSAFKVVRFNSAFYYVTSTMELSTPKSIEMFGGYSPDFKGVHNNDDLSATFSGTVIWTDQDIDVLHIALSSLNLKSYHKEMIRLTGGKIDVSECGRHYTSTAVTLYRTPNISLYPIISTSLVGGNVFSYSNTNDRFYCTGNGLSFIDYPHLEENRGNIYAGHVTSYIARFYKGFLHEGSNMTNVVFDCGMDYNVYAYDFGENGNSGGSIGGFVQAWYWFNTKTNGQPVIDGNLTKLAINARFWDINGTYSTNSSYWYSNEYVTTFQPSMIQYAPTYGENSYEALLKSTKNPVESKMLSYGGMCLFPDTIRALTATKEEYLPHLDIIHNHYYGYRDRGNNEIVLTLYKNNVVYEADTDNKFVEVNNIFGSKRTIQGSTDYSTPFKIKGQYEDMSAEIEVKVVNDSTMKGIGKILVVLPTNNKLWGDTPGNSWHESWGQIKIRVLDDNGNTIVEKTFTNPERNSPSDVSVYSLNVGSLIADKVVFELSEPTLRNNQFYIPLRIEMSAYQHYGYDQIFSRGIYVPTGENIYLSGLMKGYDGTRQYVRRDDGIRMYTDNNGVEHADVLYYGMIGYGIKNAAGLSDDLRKSYDDGTLFSVADDNWARAGIVMKMNNTFVEPEGHKVSTFDFLKKDGATSNRPTLANVYNGFKYFDTDLGIPIYAKKIGNDWVWVNEEGVDMTNVTYVRGTTTQRDSMSSIGSANSGLRFYNETVNKWQFWDGSSWYNFDGTSA